MYILYYATHCAKICTMVYLKIEDNMQVVTFSDFRQNMKVIMNNTAKDHDLLVVTRQNSNPMVMMSLDDYNGCIDSLRPMLTQHIPVNFRKDKIAKLKAVQSSNEKAKKQHGSLFGIFKDSVKIHGDIVNFDSSEMWESLK